MQEEEKKPGTETDQAQEVNNVKLSVVPNDTPEVIEESIPGGNQPPDVTGVPEKQEKKIMMMPPPWRILNGSGKICLQMERRGDKMTESGLILPGQRELLVAEKFKSPIPSDAMFFIVDYDPDINYNYRKEKLKALGLQEGNKKHDIYIHKMDQSGDLDVLRKGDQVHFNTENFMPVKIKTDWDTYYVVHFLDILGITKTYPRTRLEEPQITTHETN